MSPFASYAILCLALLAPLLAWQSAARLLSRGGEAAPRIGRRYADAVMAGALAVATLAISSQLLAVRPLIEGVDFYYYLCVARDLADGAPTSQTRHFYFPGVYRFWGAVFAVFGRSLPAIQTAYLALLVANAAAIAAVVWRGVGSAAPALLAGLLYLALCSSLEGFAGITEPLATLPVLVGLAVWAGEPLAGRRGLARALVLGAGLGLGVYAKQLAGLLALGAAALPLVNAAAPRDLRHRWAYLALIPAAATLVLLVGILAEGDGLAPLRIGLSAVSGYEPQGTLQGRLRWVVAHAPLLFAATVGFLAIYALLALVPRWRPLLGERWAALAGFAFLGALAALAQFSRRAYLHYALLLAPLAIVAITLVATALVRRLPTRVAAWPGTQLVVAALAGLPLVQPPQGEGLLHAWPLAIRVELAQPPPWRAQPDIAADLAVLKSLLQPGEDLLIIPPRRNEIHFQLGTRSRSFAPGYSWAPGRGVVEAAVRNPELDAVLLLRTHLDATDVEVWHSLDCDRGASALIAAGFRPLRKLRTMTLYRRRASEARSEPQASGVHSSLPQASEVHQD